ncbi:hypothetical protein KR059_002344, partial [Drosophila kikkawai]
FTVLAQSDIRQDTIEDFLASHADGDFLALIGSKSNVVTLEMTHKNTFSAPFSYILADFEFSAMDPRPLDVLANQVNLESIYESCNVLEAQALALEPVYTSVCSAAVPPAKLRAVKKANGLLPNGNLLLASLNTRGSIIFMSKPSEYPGWSLLESLNVAVILRDNLLPPMKSSKINNFQKYQAFMDRAWITMFAWLTSQDQGHVLVLGTANGSLWMLSLSSDVQTLREHKVLETSLDRICFLQAFEDLLLVGDVKGTIRLYRVSTSHESCLVLIKELWSKADRMGLQRGVITRCPERGCYYITCCKAAHLLTWCMQENEEWLETRLYVGGMKITGLSALGHNSYVVGNISKHLQRIQISHEGQEFSLKKQSIPMDMLENFEVLDLSFSLNGNLLTVFLNRNKEYMNSHLWQRSQIVVQVGKLQDENAEETLARLANKLKFNEPINPYTDYLAELRMKIFSQKELQTYLNFSPLDSFQFVEDATDSQLLKLKIKYHVLQAIAHLHSNFLELTEHARKFLDEMELLLAMLVTTHIRLRLQYLRTLSKLTPFQEEAAKSMFKEAFRLINKLKSDFNENHPLKTTTNAFVEHISTHLEILHLKLGGNPPKNMDPESEMPGIRCCVSYLEISLSLERRYCTLCDRQILMELENLQELYEHNDSQQITCPFCHGSFTEELLNA